MANVQEVKKSELGALLNPMVKDILQAEMKEVVELIEEKARTAAEAAIAPLKAKSMPEWAENFFGAQKKQPTGKERKPGEAAGRIVRAIARAKKEGIGEVGVEKVLKSWGDDDLARDFAATREMNDAREKALAASSATAGGFLVPEQYSNDILEARRARAVVRGLGPRMYPMPNGTFHLPKITSGASGGYIGENQNLSTSQPVFGENVLTWKKLGAIVPGSNDLVRYASAAADATVRDDLVKGLSVNEDAALLRGDGTGGAPKGLRYWAAADNIEAASTASLANVATDMGRLMLNLMNNNVPDGNWAWIFAPRTWFYLYTLQTTTGDFAFQQELNTGKFYGLPFRKTTGIPITLTVGGNSDTSEIYLVNFDDMALGDSMNLAIDISTEAAYHNGSSVVSSFSLDQFVIRAIAEHDFVARDANSIAILNGVRWGA